MFSRSCPAPCNPMDCSPPGSSVHKILQARMREWVATSSSRGSAQLRDRTGVSYISCPGRWILLPLSSLENPFKVTVGQNKYDYKTVNISVRGYLIIFKTLSFTMVLKERSWKIIFLTFGHKIILLLKVKVKSLSRVWLFATPWTVAYQAPMSMGFSRQES